MDLLNDYYGSSESSCSTTNGSSSSSVKDVQTEVGPPLSNKNESASCNNNKGSNKPLMEMIDVVPLQSVSAGTFVRSVPHIPGNWAGHIFCPLPVTSELHDAMTESVDRFRRHLTNNIGFRGNQLISHADGLLHVSLSRPFALQLSSIESFVERLQTRLQYLPATTLRVSCTTERILVNDERTRSFWVWPVIEAENNPTLMAIMEEINAVLRTYNQTPYYDPPLFHISVASVVGDLEKGKRKSTTFAPAHKVFNRNYIILNQVHCTFGTTQYYKIDLSER